MAKTRIPQAGELPAGTYYIGDPCYVVADGDDWAAFCTAYDKASPDATESAVITFKGRQCFVSSTNTGDGCYRDNYGDEYPVDAGMLAAVPADLVPAPTRAGLVHSKFFVEPFRVGADKGRWKRRKRIQFGHLTINT